jgi:hypothetical protein
MWPEVSFRPSLLLSAKRFWAHLLHGRHHARPQAPQLFAFVVQLHRECPWTAGRQPQRRPNPQLPHRPLAAGEPCREQIDVSHWTTAEETQRHVQQFWVEHSRRGSLAGALRRFSHRCPRPFRKPAAHLRGRVHRHEQPRCRPASHRFSVDNAPRIEVPRPLIATAVPPGRVARCARRPPHAPKGDGSSASLRLPPARARPSGPQAAVPSA